MSLEKWLANGWLQKYATSKAEVQDWLKVADRELKDAELEGLSTDGRLDLAYSAGLQIAVIALALAGYRIPKGGGHHQRTIEALEFTLSREIRDSMLPFNRARNRNLYMRAGATSEVQAKEMVLLAKKMRAQVMEMLREHGLIEQ